MTKNVGEIEYTLNVDTQNSVKAAKDATENLDRTEKGMKNADKQANKLNTGMNKLAKGIKSANTQIAGVSSSLGGLKSAIGGVVALLGAKAIIDMADQYTEAASRIRQVTESTEEYEKVQQRLLDTANKTYRPLQEAQEVYIRTSSSIKDLGYSTEQALDITDSFSYLLVTNAASAERAGSAINNYSKAIQTGKVDSLTWQSILSAMPSVVSDIANVTGETEAKIRELGITGKLSLEALNEALLHSRDNNEQLAEAMDTTVGDAIVSLKNSMQVFVAKVNESSGATNGLVEAIELVSAKLQDPATIKAAQDLAAGVANAFVTAIEVVTTTLDMAKWAGESFAAMVGGIAPDDVVRISDEISRLENEISSLNKELEYTDKIPFLGDTTRKAIEARQKNLEYYTNLLIGAQEALEQEVIAERKAEEARKAAAKAAEEAAKAKTEADKKAARAAIKAAEEAKKRAEAEAKAAKKAAEALKAKQKAEQDDIKILQDLAEAIYQTTLNADELAERQAELALSEYATPEQVEQAKRMAVQLRLLNDEAERKKKIGDDATGYIRGDTEPLSGGMFDDGQARYDAERKREEERYREQIERLIEAQQLQMITQQEYYSELENLHQQHTDRLNEIDRIRLNMQLAAYSSGFTTMSNDLMNFAQTFGVENKKMFAIIKASAVAGAIVDTYLSAQKAYTSLVGIPVVGPGLATAAAGAAIMGGMARVAQIRAQNISGGREHGGVVSANQFYRVNEGGKPEIFQGADGNQYMMPTQNGEVISNKEAQGKGGGNINVIINLNESQDKAGQMQESEDETGDKVIDIFVADLMGDGRAAGAIQQKFGLASQGV